MDDALQAGDYCEKNLAPEKCTPEGVQKELGVTHQYVSCSSDYANATACHDAFKTWTENKKERLKAGEAASKGIQSTKTNFLPDCALEDKITPPCDDVSIFLILAINISRYVFSIVGGLSLLMFVYAGFILIISQGNSEKIEQGKNIMMAVVIGLLIAFGGYLLVSFLGQSLGLQANFRLL
jgi:hypothetical protein